MHRDHVPSIPSSYNGSKIELLGSTPSTPNQGYVLYRPDKEPHRAKSIQIFSVQGHPEFTQRIVEVIVEARGPKGNKLMSPEVATESKDRAAWRNDGDTVIGKVIWDVLTASA
jgi:GMP synthase-like glutamine amidotransferase